MSHCKLNPQVGDIVRVRPPQAGRGPSVYPEYRPGATFIVTSLSGSGAFARCAKRPNDGYAVGQLEVIHRFQIVTSPKGGKIILNHGTRTAQRLAAPDTQRDEDRLVGLRNNFLHCDTYPLVSLDAKAAGKLYNETMQALHGSAYRAPKEVRKVDDSMPGISRDELREKLRTKNKHLSSVLRELDDELARHAITQDNLRRSLESHADLTLLLQRERATIAELQAKLLPVGGSVVSLVSPDILDKFATYCAERSLSFTITSSK